MDSIKHLLSFFLKIAIAIFFIVILIRVALMIPRTQVKSTSTSTNATSTPQVDILPSPRKYSGFFTSTATTGPKVYGNTLVTPTPFVYGGPIASVGGTASNNTSVIKSADGYTYNTYDYSAYPTTVDAEGKYVVTSAKTNTDTNTDTNIKASTQPSAQTQSSSTSRVETAAERRLNIRNLSLYEGGHVYTGFSFVGEARSTMFREGRFPIIVIDATGKLVGISTAVAQTQWAVPGWVRFETKVNYSLPSNAPCTMIFEEALTAAEKKLRAPNRVPFGVRCN